VIGLVDVVAKKISHFNPVKAKGQTQANGGLVLALLIGMHDPPF
jgi:hypothetical protein